MVCATNRCVHIGQLVKVRQKFNSLIYKVQSATAETSAVNLSLKHTCNVVTYQTHRISQHKLQAAFQFNAGNTAHNT